MPFNVEMLESALAESTSTRINTDLRPISYSHGLAVWTAKERTPRSGVLQKLITAPARWLERVAAWTPALRWVTGLLLLGLCVAVIFAVRPKRSSAVGLAVACSGFTEITVEIIVLLSFQALYGYVYVMLGLVLASFMAGLCLGGECASRLIRNLRGRFGWLLAAQWALAAYPVVLVFVAWGASRAGAGGWPVVGAFLALTVAAGFTGGLQFPLAASVMPARKQGVAAKLYALDLGGGALGAITVSALFIPTLGFITLALITAGLGLAALAGLYRVRGRADATA